MAGSTSAYQIIQPLKTDDEALIENEETDIDIECEDEHAVDHVRTVDTDRQPASARRLSRTTVATLSVLSTVVVMLVGATAMGVTTAGVVGSSATSTHSPVLTPARIPVTECQLGYRFFMWPTPSVFHHQVWSHFNDSHPNWPTFNEMRQTVFLPRHSDAQTTTEMIFPFTLQQHPCRTMDPEQATFFVWPMFLYYIRAMGESKDVPIFIRALDVLHQAFVGVPDPLFQFMDEQHALDQQRLQTLVAQFPAKELAARDGSLILSADDMAVMFPDRPRISESAPIPIQFPALGSPLPSTLKQYWTRFNTCDQVMIGSRPFMNWDRDRAWSIGTAPYGRPIYLALEINNVNDYRNNWDLAKNIEFPYITNPHPVHDHAQYLLCRQHLLAIEQLWFNYSTQFDLRKRCVPATADEQSVFDRYVAMRAAASNANPNASSTVSEVLPRSLLGYFLGSPQHTPRQRLMNAINKQREAGQTDLVFENLSDRVANRAGISTDAMFGYFNSKFCFVMHGDSPSSKRFFDMLVSGCIPVIAEDSWVLPLPSLPWHDMALRFPYHLIEKEPQLIFDTLRSIPTERVVFMQSVILRHRHVFFYPLPQESFRPHHDDAVDGVMRELALRKHYAKTCKYPMQQGTM